MKMTLGLPSPSTAVLKMFWTSHTTHKLWQGMPAILLSNGLYQKKYDLMVNYIWNGRLWVDYKNLLENTGISCLVWCLLSGLGSYAHVHYKKQFLSCMTSLCRAYVTLSLPIACIPCQGWEVSIGLAVRTPREDLRDVQTSCIFCPVLFYKSKWTWCQVMTYCILWVWM